MLWFFFHMHSINEIYCLKLYHLLNFTLHSKENACNIGTFIRFYMQMRMAKNPAFAYRFYRPFTTVHLAPCTLHHWIILAPWTFMHEEVMAL